jgi:nucleotide-binding universal stress UspA family protein
MGRIVVGVDGSEGSRRALRWAVREARLRGADLDVVCAVAEPHAWADPVLFPPAPTEDLRGQGLALLDEVLAGIDLAGVPVERISAVGGGARVLLEAAIGADLLVVGSRGRGGFKALMLGSVAQQAVTHAACPVVVVVPEHRASSLSRRQALGTKVPTVGPDSRE